MKRKVMFHIILKHFDFESQVLFFLHIQIPRTGYVGLMLL